MATYSINKRGLEFLSDTMKPFELSPGQPDFKKVIRLEDLQGQDLEIVTDMLECLGFEDGEINNLGMATYSDHELKRFDAPIIEQNEPGKICLTIGSDRKSEGVLKTHLPLMVEDGRLVLVNGNHKCPVSLDKLDWKRGNNEDMTSPIAFFISPRTNNSYTFSIAVQQVPEKQEDFQDELKDKYYNHQRFSYAWDQRNYEILANFIVKQYESTPRANLTYLATEIILNNTFKPFVIPILGATHSVGAYGGQYLLDIDLSHLEPFPIRIGSKTKGFESVLSTEIFSLYIGEKQKPYQDAKTAFKQGYAPTPHKPWFLYVRAPNAKGAEAYPDSTIFRDLVPNIHNLTPDKYLPNTAENVKLLATTTDF